jgi:hypothetical protein
MFGKLQALITVFGRITGTNLKEIVIGFDIYGKVNSFACGKLFGGLKDNIFAVMVGTFEVTSESNFVDVFTTFGGVCSRDFILGIDSGKWALWHTCATVDAGVRVDVHPRPFCYRLSRDNTLHRAYFNATAVTNA